MRCGTITWWALLPAALSATAGPGASLVRAEDVLNEQTLWRRYYCFGPSRISAVELKRAGAGTVGAKVLDSLQKDTEGYMAAHGIKAGDWRDHAVWLYRGPRSFNPPLTPHPPADWARPEFDDSDWARLDHPFQGSAALRLTNMSYGQFDESVDMMLLAAFYRTRFVVEDPAAAGTLTVRLAYAGGVRVLVNGNEIARGHLPAGDLSPDTCADGYPGSAYAVAEYTSGGPGQSAPKETPVPADRKLGPVAIPASVLVKGVNVLAVEIRASAYHPVALTAPRQPNWNGPQRPFPHARLAKVVLSTNGHGVTSALRRPAGPRVWVDDPHHRLLSTTFLPPGEPAGTVRFVGARNGSYSAQIVVGSDRPLAGLQVSAGELVQAGGAGRLAAGAMQILYTVPYPLAKWTLAELGDERGVGASFPSNAELSRLAGFAGSGPFFFDQLTAEAPANIPANCSYPARLLLSVPADAPAGTYRGAVEVRAQGMEPVKLPVEAEVIDWKLPAPRDFQTLVGCEENPYAVARQYGVQPWSDRHFELLEANFRQLGRIGNAWLSVPVLARSEFGNGEDSPIRWLRKGDGSLDFDFTVLDRYLDLAIKHCGNPRVVQFVVMHNMKSRLSPMPPPQVRIGGALHPMWANDPAGRAAWRAFATALAAHMKAKGPGKAMYWGAPEEQEYDPDLKEVLAAAAPGIFWTCGPHQTGYGSGATSDRKYYQMAVDIRCMGGFRTDQGWKSSNPTVLLNPRVGGNVFALHTSSFPFAFRAMPGRALAMGRNGFARVGADEWAATHYCDMVIPRYMVGRGTLFVLWPGKDGAQSSARFEALREGVQDTEARIFLEQALERGLAPANLAAKVRKVLADDFRDTSFFQGNSVIYSLEENDTGWQRRSRALFQAAAEVAEATGDSGQ
ncbi:MAG: hypothetical protein BIFFINMI_00902 [Phycisphaerae bacterium]|nr:hypothetical protein [Phycisphaerae bacterium]